MNVSPPLNISAPGKRNPSKNMLPPVQQEIQHPIMEICTNNNIINTMIFSFYALLPQSNTSS
jgi:hypothetical protein